MDEQLIYNNEFYDFLTGKASRAIARRLQRNLKSGGVEISAEQWSILYQLWKKEGLTQQEIAHQTYKDKPSITRLLNRLESQNLVVRVPHHEDKRVNLLYLTQKGKDLKEKGVFQANKTIKEALKNIEEEEMKSYRKALQKVVDNLQ